MVVNQDRFDPFRIDFKNTPLHPIPQPKKTGIPEISDFFPEYLVNFVNMLKELKIRPSLFWDIDPEKISEKENRRIIIERVINLGNLSEWIQIVNYYGLETIKKEIIYAGDLYPKTLAFIESYLGIQKSDLRCYTKKQLNQQLWSL